jgi:hypothetical protein
MNEELLKRLEDLERRVAVLEKPASTPLPPQNAKPLSLREFMLSKSPQTEVDVAIVIAYYFEKHSGISSFTSEDLKNGFAQAKEPSPVNPSEVLAKNARKGFIMEASEKKKGLKAWVLTNTGERYVENGLKLPTTS